jgi:flagellar hook-associated protein 3 FlgL
MRISTNEFLLGSLNDLLAQQSTVNQLNREIATGQTMLDATSDPGGAAQVVGLANQLARLNYDSGNAGAATQTLQTGVSALQQVNNLLVQLRQSAVSAANGTANVSDRQSLVASAQTVLQQLVQLANTQGPNGGYLFSGSTPNRPAFATLGSGQVVFNGDNGGNQVEIAPSLNVASTISGQNIFVNIPAGTQGVAVSAASGNTGTAYAVVDGVTSLAQVTAAGLAGTQYQIAFTAGAGSSLNYTVTSGTGTPGSAGFTASQGVVASDGFTAASTSSSMAARRPATTLTCSRERAPACSRRCMI